MIVDRYYYNQLNKNEQAIYKIMYKGVMAHEDIIPVSVKGNISADVFTKIFNAITRDNPLIYYLNQSACSIAQDAFGRIAVCPQYFYSKEKVKEYNRKIEGVVNPLVEQLNLMSGTDYDKALKVHDWLCQNVKYDKEGSDVKKIVSVINSHNIIGVFAHHKAQCEGIAKAAKVLLNTVDVKCIVAVGDANSKTESGPHAWNVVNLDGVPYQMDITWDIGAIGQKNDRIPCDYFLITDDLCNKEHKAQVKLPVCDSLELNYFTKNKLAFDSKSRLLAYITKTLAMGQTEFYFRVFGKLKVGDVNREASDCISKYMISQGYSKVRISQIVNETVGTCWMKVC